MKIGLCQNRPKQYANNMNTIRVDQHATTWVSHESITCVVDIQPHISMTRMVCTIETIRNIYIQTSKWVVGLVDVEWNCFQRGGGILLVCSMYGPGLGHLTVAERVAWGTCNLFVIAHMYGLHPSNMEKTI